VPEKGLKTRDVENQPMNLFRFFIYAFVMVVCTAGVSYVQHKRPEAIEQLIVRVDVFALSEVASKERERMAQIAALQIPFEQKKVLMERNIFMGATRQMVFLALGNPVDAKSLLNDEDMLRRPAGDRYTERWVYYFKDDQRPTILEFKEEQLMSAYKASKLDI
jgi:hypothetical protein